MTDSSTKNKPSRLISLQAAAERLGRSANTLRWWKRVGLGPAWVKMGRRVMYEEATIEKFIADNTHLPSVQAYMEDATDDKRHRQ